MGPHKAPPTPKPQHELRILVLHNRDFDPGLPLTGHIPLDLVARADVVNSARDVARALASRGHFVEVQGTDVTDVGPLLARLQADRPDLVFNLCESLGGDARHEVVVPALLDMLRIPYTGSGPLGLGLALRKERTKTVLHAAGVNTPRSSVLPSQVHDLDPDEDLRGLRHAGLRYPLIVKPTREDASEGISPLSVVYDDDELCQQVALLREAYDQPLLCEEYIAGREITVSLLGNSPPEVLPLHEIDFSLMPSGQPHIVCYRAKWDTASAECAGTKPRRAGVFDAAVQERIELSAQAAFQALELSDYGRCDVRLTDRGEPYVIDVNPNCDLSDGAGFSLAARSGGLSYEHMVDRIVAHALHRSRHEHSQRRGERPNLHLLDSSGSAGGSAGAAGARHEGRSLYAGRGEGRARTHRQRAL